MPGPWGRPRKQESKQAKATSEHACVHARAVREERRQKGEFPFSLSLAKRRSHGSGKDIFLNVTLLRRIVPRTLQTVGNSSLSVLFLRLAQG